MDIIGDTRPLDHSSYQVPCSGPFDDHLQVMIQASTP